MASSNINMLHKTVIYDEVYTPVTALEPIIKYLDRSKVYYDCTSRYSSSIIDYLKVNNFIIKSSGDKDFLNDSIPNDIDIIITNPPYSKKDKFIKKCYELNKPFMLLLPVTSIQGQFRGKLFNKYGIELLVLNKRIDFTGKGSPHFGVAWFCHNILPKSLIFE